MGAIFQASELGIPRWADWVRNVIALSGLLLLSAYLVGVGAAQGWVKNVNDPSSWGLIDGTGVVLFAIAAFGVAGSEFLTFHAVGKLLRRGGIGGVIQATFALLVGMVLSFIVVYISASARSYNLRASPLDKWVMRELGWPTDIPTTPTLILVSILPPLMMGVWAMFQTWLAETPVVEVVDPEELARQQQVEAMRAEHAVRLAQIAGQRRGAQLAGLGGAARAAVQAARGRVEPEPDPEPDGDSAPAAEDNAAAGFGEMGQPAPVTRPRVVANVSDLGTMVNGEPYWDADELLAYCQRQGVPMTREVASSLVHAMGHGTRLPRKAGRPYGAPAKVLKAHVQKLKRAAAGASTPPAPVPALAAASE